jgi:hypothetical protein
VLRRIFGPKREEVAGGWRRLHNEELRNLDASPNIVRVIKLRMKRWVGRVARMGDEKYVQYFLLKNPKGRDHLEEVGVECEDNNRMDLSQIG